jgi:acetoacetate decarboxylase
MGAVRYGARTTDQLENKEVSATKIGAWSTALTATFPTDPSVIEAVLPPPLSLPDNPVCKVSISRVDLGSRMPPFGAGTFAVSASHEGKQGFYPLLMPMSTEQAVLGGRETFGEPKKLAKVTQDIDGDSITGIVARLGIDIIEVKGTIGPDLEPPEDEERVDFYFKFLPAPDGNGFDADPSLVYCYRETQTRSHKGVTGTVTLNESRFDPVVDIPMLGDPTITLSERRSAQRGEIVATVPSADLIPYQHQRYDDLSPVGKK